MSGPLTLTPVTQHDYRLGWREVNEANSAHYALLARDIQRFLDRPAETFSQAETSSAPPGAPIGQPAMDWLGRLEPVCSWWDW